MWISLGNFSEVALIFAQTDPEKKHRGLACFLVPTASEGFTTQEIHGKLGLRSSDTGELSLDGVEVGEDAMLGEIGDGFKVAMSALDNGRYSVAAGCVGICDGCVDASVAYSKERKQFGVPLARFQLVQEMIADMIVKRDASRMLVYRAGAAEGRRQAEHDGDLGGEAARDRGGGRMRQPGDPGARRRRLRRRLPGRALPARRPRDDPLRGDLADPEADHRPRRDRDQRDDARWRRNRPEWRELVETSLDEPHVALLRLNRPEARNALSPEMMEQLITELERLDPGPDVRCIVIAGSEKVFAAGADIKAMSERSFAEALTHPSSSFWRRLAAVKTPTIAAVSGYALGGGCELALACDMIVASDTAVFGQPEINARHHPRRRRHAAPGAGDRQAAGDGAGAHRAPLRRERRPRARPRQQSRGERKTGSRRRWRWPTRSPSSRRSPPGSPNRP